MKVLTELTSHPFARDFPRTVLERLAPLGKLVRYGPGEVILREGQVASRFLLISAGRVRVDLHSHDQGRLTIQTLGPGEVAGWSWFLEPHLGAFDLICQEELSGIEFAGEELKKAMEADLLLGFTLSKSLVRVVADRLQATRLQLLDLYHPRKAR